MDEFYVSNNRKIYASYVNLRHIGCWLLLPLSLISFYNHLSATLQHRYTQQHNEDIHQSSHIVSAFYKLK